MSKTRVYLQPADIKDSILIDNKDTLHKLKSVLRIKVDDEVYIFDGQGQEYLYKVKSIKKARIEFLQLKLIRKEDMPHKRITLAMPLTKEEKIDFILQKATELGVFSFIPFICQRSISKLPSNKKIERWNRIVAEAVRQSERLWLPRIKPVVTFDELLQSDISVKLAGSLKGVEAKHLVQDKWIDVLIAIGPEGDFTQEEENQFRNNYFKFIKLSPYLLRVETAAICAVALINHLLDS